MRLEDNGVIRKLYPDEGCRLYSIKTNQYYEVVYLGKFDSVDNYKDVPIEEPEPPTEDEIDEKILATKEELEAHIGEANNVNDEQDGIIIELATQLSIIQLSL